MIGPTLWAVAGMVALVYCISRTILDFRRGAYAWSMVGMISIASFWTIPFFFLHPEPIRSVPVAQVKIGD